MNTVVKLHRNPMRIHGTEQQIRALSEAVAHTLNRRQDEVNSTRRQIEQFTRQLATETDEASKAHIMKMISGWREHLQWVESKGAQAATAADFMNRAEIVTHKG